MLKINKIKKIIVRLIHKFPNPFKRTVGRLAFPKVGWRHPTFRDAFKNRWYIPAGLVVALIVIILSFVLFRNSEQVKAEWYNDSWHYRMQFDVFNASTTQPLTDFQVKIPTSTLTLSTLYTNSKVKSNFADLRFTDINGNLLDYWFNDATSTMPAVYVKFPNLPKNATSTMFMYYGNTSATDERNGSAVFPDFFENFNDNNLSDWTKDDTWTGQNGYAHFTTGGSGMGSLIKILQTNNEFVVDTFLKSNGYDAGILIKSNSNASSYYFLGFGQGGTWFGLGSQSGWQQYVSKSVGTSWKLISAVYASNGSGMKVVHQDGTSVSWADTANTGSYFGLFTWASTSQVDYDYIVVRKYAAAGPNIRLTAGASEEIGGGPIGYWKFDEGYGTVAYDSSSYKNNGTLTNMSTTGTSTAWQVGKVGKALMFDGTNDYVNITNPIGLDSAQGSISYWMKINEINNEQTQFDFYQTGYTDFIRSYISPSNVMDLSIEQGNVTKVNVTYDLDNLAGSFLNKWLHIVWLQDGSSIKLYINGKQLNLSGTNSGSWWTSHLALTVGNIGAGSWGYTNAVIDEFKIYNYALTASQILTEYNQGKSVILSQTPEQSQNLNEGLVGHWKMDESTTAWDGAGDRVNDYSGNGNNGTASGHAHATTTAKYGNAGEFDGTDDNVLVTNSGAFNFGKKSFTLSAWVKTTRNNSFVIFQNYGGSGFALYNHGISLSQGATIVVVTGPSWNDNNWHYVVGVVDYDKLTAKYYHDGMLSAQTNLTAGFDISSNNNINIGYYNGGGTYDWLGLIDDVKIYNTARTPDQIMQDYLQGPNPIAYYDFEEGQGTTLSDKSGQGNNSSSFGGGLGASSDWVKGKYGRALDFDGDNDYIDFGQPNFSKFNDSAFSIGFWMYGLTQSDSLAGIMGKTNTGDFSNNANNKKGWIVFYIGNSIYLRMSDNDNDDTLDYDSIGLSIADNIKKWTYVVFTIEKGVGSANLKVYKNGLASGSAARTIYSSGIVDDSTGNLNFGRWQTYDRNFNGSLDEVKFWNYALTPWQIAQEYNNGAPIANWNFDEGNGTLAHDSSDNGLTGTLTNMSTSGTSTAWQLGKVGKSLLYSGASTDYVVVNDPGTNSALDFTSAYSISAWVKINSNNNVYNSVVFKYTTYSLLVFPTGDVRIYANPAGSWGLKLTSKQKLQKNTWYHLVSTYDSSASLMKLYIDGALNQTASVTGDLTPSNNPLYIGRGYTGESGEMKGLIDEVKMYNYALSPAQIKKDYNDSKAVVMGTDDGGQQSQQGLVGFWKMDESTTVWDGAGDRVNDYSGNNYTGTAYNHAHATSTAKYGNSAEFDGADDYVGISSYPTFGKNGFTISSWIYARAIGSSQQIVYGGTIQLRPSIFYVYVNNNWVYVSFTQPSLNSWHFLVGTYDKQYIKVYVDGSFVGKTAVTGDISNNSELTFGSRRWDNNECFNGLIDDVKIYNIVRTPDQIMRDYLQGPGPIAYYDFEEGSGTTANDKSGQGHNGTITAGTGGYKKGKIGTAYEFDGANTKVDTGSDFIGASAVSVSAWIYLDSYGEGESGTRGVVISNGSSWVSKYTIYVRSSNQNIAMMSGSGSIIMTASNSILLGRYYHIVVTTSSRGAVTFYINGAYSTSGTSGPPTPGSSNVIIGNLSGQNISFDGKIDDVKIWNYVLTPWQVAQEYNNGQPVGWWLLDEGEGGTVHDNSGNNYNGTLILNGSPATSTAWQAETSCKTGRCLDFDGTDDYVYIQNGALISNVNYSITGWIKIDDLMASDGIIFSNDNDSANTIIDTIGIRNSKLAWNYDSAGTYKAESTKGFTLNEWGHFAFVSDGGRTGTIKIYINGAEDIITTTGFYRSGADVRIGGRNSSNKPFYGSIDDLRIYNYPLSPQQIKEEFNAGFGTYFK